MSKLHIDRHDDITLICNNEDCKKLVILEYGQRKRKFCSRKCAAQGKYNNFYNKTHSKSSLRRGVIKRLKTIQLNLNSIYIDTKPELLFESYLKELNINYKKQVILSFWSFDFYLIDYNIYIEIDGDYWHANPQFYSNKKLTESQIKQKSTDKSKNTFMQNRNNVLIRFWENEVIDKKDYILNQLNIICKKSVAC